MNFIFEWQTIFIERGQRVGKISFQNKIRILCESHREIFGLLYRRIFCLLFSPTERNNREKREMTSLSEDMENTPVRRFVLILQVMNTRVFMTNIYLCVLRRGGKTVLLKDYSWSFIYSFRASPYTKPLLSSRGTLNHNPFVVLAPLEKKREN